jgi:anti-sigma factor RsiW
MTQLLIMFDFLRNLTKSAEEKRQEQLHAYLDNGLTPRERQQFEQELAQDTSLKTEIDGLRLMKQQLRNLPRRPVPRSFTLDPAVYGRPARQPLFQFYPVLQGATVLTALFFVLALSLTLFQPQRAAESTAARPQAAMNEEASGVAQAPAAELFAEDSAAGAAREAASEEVEVTRVVTEVIVEEAAEEELVAEQAVAEEAAETGEEVMEEGEASAEPFGATASDAEPADETVSSTATAVPPNTSAPAEATSASAATLPLPTTTAVPTPTVSELPRASYTPTTDTRSLNAAATVAYEDGQTTTNADTSPPAEQQSVPAPTLMPVRPTEPITNPLRFAQVGLGILLIIFGALTFYVRRNS